MLDEKQKMDRKMEQYITAYYRARNAVEQCNTLFTKALRARGRRELIKYEEIRKRLATTKAQFVKHNDRAGILEKEILKWLDDEYQIRKDSRYLKDGRWTEPYGVFGNCSIYDDYTVSVPDYGLFRKRLKIENIKEIITFIDGYQKRVGERPDIDEIDNYFYERGGLL